MKSLSVSLGSPYEVLGVFDENDEHDENVPAVLLCRLCANQAAVFCVNVTHKFKHA